MRYILSTLIVFICLSASAQQKRHAFLGWYSYLNGSEARLLFWEPLPDIYLFPDSTVRSTIYTDSTDTFSYVNLHTVGQAFASNSFLYVDPLPLPYFCSYRIDSIGFYYRYNHLIPGSVDTLRLQMFYNDEITRQQATSPWYATVPIDTATNLADTADASFTIDILLDATNHTGLNINDTQFLKIALPNRGKRVKQKKGAAFMVTYIPGYNYNTGDTLQSDYATPPKKQLNGFLPVLYRDTTKYYDTTANNGLFLFKSQKYSSGDSMIAPGNLFPNTNWVLDAHFFVTENICGSDNVELLNTPDNLSIYPNPASGVLNIMFNNYQPAYYQVTITDVTGKTMLKDDNNDSINISSLANGIYYLHITTTGETITKKFIVQH